MSHTALVLVTSTPPTQTQEDNQRKVITWLQAKKVSYKEVDAVQDKGVREELTTISQLKGKYPQVFVTDNESSTKFIGDFDAIQEMVELEGLDQEFLKNPDIASKTMKEIFKFCIP